MNILEPVNQIELFGLSKYFNELVKLENRNILPNKILLSGQKGLGKSTLAYHFINYVLSKNEPFNYDIDKFMINIDNTSFKTVLNKSNPNLILIDIDKDKKSIDVHQIRELISNLNKSSFNNKPRFVLIDNIEFLNVNSINALLKILEEPTLNTFFILINNDKKVLATLLSRCINFRISLTNTEILDITEKLLNGNLNKIINKDLINYYLTPGNIFRLFEFGKSNDYDLLNLNLKDLLKLIIKNNHFKSDNSIKYLFYDFIEFYFKKINKSISSDIYKRYSYYLKRISDTKKFNLDEESLLIEFEKEMLNA